jgi:hypothetical protein
MLEPSRELDLARLAILSLQGSGESEDFSGRCPRYSVYMEGSRDVLRSSKTVSRACAGAYSTRSSGSNIVIWIEYLSAYIKMGPESQKALLPSTPKSLAGFNPINSH